MCLSFKGRQFRGLPLFLVIRSKVRLVGMGRRLMSIITYRLFHLGHRFLNSNNGRLIFYVLSFVVRLMGSIVGIYFTFSMVLVI